MSSNGASTGGQALISHTAAQRQVQARSTIHTAAGDTDLAFAELQLLEQNQRKLSSLTTRMTGILSGFDRRLGKLESSILPIHTSTQRLLRIGRNIDATLGSLNQTLGHHDTVVDEEPLIHRGPDAQDVGSYMQTLDRVQEGLTYLQKSDLKSQDEVLRRMYDLLEVGSAKLGDLAADWVAAESVNPIDPHDFVGRSIPWPALSDATENAVIPILSYLQPLPVSPTTYFNPFLHALASIADHRGQYVDNSMKPVGKAVHLFGVERVAGATSAVGLSGMANAFGHGVDDGDADASYRRGSAGVSEWVESLIAMAENEYAILGRLLASLDPPCPQSTILSTFSRIIKRPLATFNSHMGAVHSHVRRNLTTHTFFALDVVWALSSAAGRWDVTMLNYAGKNREKDDTAEGLVLGEQLMAIRGTLMQVFPKFIDDVRNMPAQREGEVPSTNVNEITYIGLHFIRQLIEFEDVVATILHTLGAGNWMMGSSAAPVLSLGFEGQQDDILTQYLNDVLATVLTALEVRSRAIRQPSTASIFLLNNLGHINRELSENEVLAASLGSVGQDLLQSAIRAANTAYLDAWGPIVSALMDDGVQRGGQKLAGLGGGGEKSAVKDRFVKFYEGLDDLERLHRAYPISKEDPQLRERLRSDVIRLVCPLYARFVQKHGDFSKNASKYIRLTDQDLQQRLNALFEVKMLGGVTSHV